MSELSTWDVLSQAVWREQVGDQTISLRHPTYPAEADWTDNNPDTLTKIVAEYVSKVSGVLGLPPLFNDGSSDFKEHMAWLPYAGGKILDPRRSFDLKRYQDPLRARGLIDHSVVFVASQARDPNNSSSILGSRQGIRVVAHLSAANAKRRHVRITSVARSQLLPESLAHHRAHVKRLT